MNKAFKVFTFLMVSLVITSSAFAEIKKSKAFQASVTPDIAIHDRNQRIEGFTVSVWGENPQTALAFGIINGSIEDSAGLNLGFINYGDSYKGVQFGFVNVDDEMDGVQFGFMNFTDSASTGFQFGLINIIKSNKKWFSNFPNELAPFMLFINWRLN